MRPTAPGTSSDDATRTWTVDTTKPIARLTVPASPSKNASPSIDFSADEPATFECKLDAAAFAACTPPRQLSGLADGSHTFTVRATDRAGNVSDPVAKTWTVDAALPTVTVNQKTGQNDPTSSLPIRFTVTFTEPVTGFTSADLTPNGVSDRWERSTSPAVRPSTRSSSPDL